MSSHPESNPQALNQRERQKKTRFAVNLGLAGNAILAALKLSLGILGHSKALLADGINSISDVVYFLVVKFFVKQSGKPADSEHPFGHYQYETIAALVVGAFVITTGLAIFWDAINSIFDLVSGETSAPAVKSFTLWIAAGTVAVKILLMIQARSAGRATHSLAVSALARDHRNDIFASLGVGAGILLSLIGVPLADPIAGAAVAMIVAKTGFSILLESADELMDTIPGHDLEKQFASVLKDVPGVWGIEEIHAHRFGPYLTATLTITIDGELRVAEADSVATAAERKLLDTRGNAPQGLYPLPSGQGRDPDPMNRKRTILLLLILTAACGFSVSARETPADSFTFFLLADPQLGMTTDNRDFVRETENMEKTIAAANRLKPSFVLVLGDLVNREGDERQIAEYLRIMGKLDPSIPVYQVPGNHDIGNKPTAGSLQRYRERFGPDYFSFEIRDVVCLGLNSSLIKDAGD